MISLTFFTVWVLFLPALGLFLPKLQDLDDTVIKKHSHWKMLVFSQVAGWEKASFLVNFSRDSELDIEKPSYLAKLQVQKKISQ